MGKYTWVEEGRVTGGRGLGRVLKAQRTALGWSMARAAARIGVTRQALGHWEAGRRVPREENLRAVMQAYGMASTTLG